MPGIDYNPEPNRPKGINPVLCWSHNRLPKQKYITEYRLSANSQRQEIWKDGRELAEDSDFRVLAQIQLATYRTLALGTKEELASLPPRLLEFYGFVEGDIVRADPYFAAAFMLAQTWSNPSATIMNFMFFSTTMKPQYRSLLAQKDAKALLLLAYWWAIVAETKK